MVGQRWPLYASATGKVVLAELEPEVVRNMLESGLQRLAPRTITDLG
jgi:DNA-binding IclR family transcriptional regulator